MQSIRNQVVVVSTNRIGLNGSQAPDGSRYRHWYILSACDGRENEAKETLGLLNLFACRSQYFADSSSLDKISVSRFQDCFKPGQEGSPNYVPWQGPATVLSVLAWQPSTRSVPCKSQTLFPFLLRVLIL